MTSKPAPNILYTCGRLCALKVSVRGEEEMKKAAIIIVLAIAVPLCLFADKWFSFSLDYNITRDCSVFFWQYETTSVFENATADVTSHLGENSFAFATLGLSFTGETIISLDLGWTPFYKKNGTGESYALETSVNMEYDLVLDLKGTASQYSWSDSQSESEDGFVNGYQVCFSRKNLVEQGNPNQLGVATNEAGKRAVADMYISNLDSEEKESGEYVSFLICYITTE